MSSTSSTASQATWCTPSQHLNPWVCCRWFPAKVRQSGQSWQAAFLPSLQIHTNTPCFRLLHPGSWNPFPLLHDAFQDSSCQSICPQPQLRWWCQIFSRNGTRLHPVHQSCQSKSSGTLVLYQISDDNAMSNLSQKDDDAMSIFSQNCIYLVIRTYTCIYWVIGPLSHVNTEMWVLTDKFHEELGQCSVSALEVGERGGSTGRFISDHCLPLQGCAFC